MNHVLLLCYIHIITAGSICTLITLHFAVSFTIPNNSFDIKHTLAVACLVPSPPNFQNFNSFHLKVYLFRWALNFILSALSMFCWVRAHCILYIILRYIECFRHVLRLHNPHTHTHASIPLLYIKPERHTISSNFNDTHTHKHTKHMAIQ